MKKNYDEKKRKVRKKKNKESKKEKEKMRRKQNRSKSNNKDVPWFFLLHKFSSASMTNPYSNLPTMCNPITSTSLMPRDHPFATCTCPPI
jgi:lysozyme family protein